MEAVPAGMYRIPVSVQVGGVNELEEIVDVGVGSGWMDGGVGGDVVGVNGNGSVMGHGVGGLLDTGSGSASGWNGTGHGEAFVPTGSLLSLPPPPQSQSQSQSQPRLPSSTSALLPPPPPPPPFRFNLTLPTASQRSQALAEVRSQSQSQTQTQTQAQAQPAPRRATGLATETEARKFVQPSMVSIAGPSGRIRQPPPPIGTGVSNVNGLSTSCATPPTPSSVPRPVRPPIPLSISFPPAIPIALIPTLSGLAAEGLGMSAYHTSVSSHLRTQLAAQLSHYQRLARPIVSVVRSPASTSAVPLVAGPSTTTIAPPRPARQQVDLAALAARDREHSNAWVLEGYKRYTSALKPEEFMLDARGAGMGMGGALGKRRRRRYTDGEGLAIGMEGGSNLGIGGVEGSAVIAEEGDLDGAKEPDRKRARIGRSPISAGSATFADQVLGRRSVSAAAELRSPSRESSPRNAPPAPSAPTSFADAVAAMHSPTVLFPVMPSVMTHGSTPGLTSEGFTSIGGLVGMEASSFEGIQTPPPAPMHNDHIANNIKAPTKSHARPTFTLSSDKLAITPVSPPRNRDKRPSLASRRKSSSAFITPARRSSLHKQHGVGSASGASGQATHSAGHETSSSSSLASLTSASLSCSQADMSPRTPAGLVHSTLPSDEVLGGVKSRDDHGLGHDGGGSLGGLSKANVAKHNGAGHREDRVESAQGTPSEETGHGPHSRRTGGGGGGGGGAEDDFWAELSEFGTPS